MHPMYFEMDINTLMGIWSDLLDAQNKTRQSMERGNFKVFDENFHKRRIQFYQEDIDAIKELIETKKKQEQGV